MTRLKDISAAVDNFCLAQKERFRPWTYSDPFLLDETRLRTIEAAQNDMFTLMKGLPKLYPLVADILGHDTATRALITSDSCVSFRPGTFRTDFIIDQTGRMSFIEVTCRFPLNGFFLSQAVNRLPNRALLLGKVELVDYDNAVPKAFVQWMEDSSKVLIVRGLDLRGHESLVLTGICQNAGIPVEAVPLEVWRHDWQSYTDHAAIIAELTFDEWLSLPTEAIKAMRSRPLLNDPQLVFLVHDKAFFALPWHDDVVSGILEKPQIEALRSIFAPTYLPGTFPDIWKDATSTPVEWVLKPRRLGKSKDIIAGALVDRSTWETALGNAERNNMILQRWHQSAQFCGMIGGIDYTDFACGTLLYWGPDFLGPGMIRTSSWPVTNIVDDRKAACLVARSGNKLSHPELLWL